MAVNIEDEDAAYRRLEGLALAAENLGSAAEKLQARHGAAVRKRSLLPNELPPPPRTVASRLMAILLTFRSGNSHSLTEIAALTGLPMSTVHRLACEMATRHLLQRQPDGRYQVGPNLQQLAGDVERVPRVDERAGLVVTDLCEATHRRARLGVLSDGRVAYVEKRWIAEAPTLFSTRATLPAHATALGKALLAFAPQSYLTTLERRMTRYTARTVTDLERLVRQLHLIRLTGIAHARGELVRGDSAIAAPIFGPGGAGIAALELRVHDREDIAMCRATLAVAARGLSRELALDVQDDGRPHLRALPPADEDGALRPATAPRGSPRR
jgi:DNA-binding IclR family transcriptional regulator